MRLLLRALPSVVLLGCAGTAEDASFRSAILADSAYAALPAIEVLGREPFCEDEVCDQWTMTSSSLGVTDGVPR
jgi:hypothetical protein